MYVPPSGNLLARSVSSLGLSHGSNTNETIPSYGDIAGKTLSISGSVSGAGFTLLLAPYALASAIPLRHYRQQLVTSHF